MAHTTRRFGPRAVAHRPGLDARLWSAHGPHRVDPEALRTFGSAGGSCRLLFGQCFHHTLYAAARMPTLKHLIDGLWLRNGPYLHLLFPDYASREQGKLRASTLAAIERRDARAARVSMQADLNKTADYLIGLLTARSKNVSC